MEAHLGGMNDTRKVDMDATIMHIAPKHISKMDTHKLV